MKKRRAKFYPASIFRDVLPTHAGYIRAMVRTDQLIRPAAATADDSAC